jgi:hypothetical protein
MALNGDNASTIPSNNPAMQQADNQALQDTLNTAQHPQHAQGQDFDGLTDFLNKGSCLNTILVIDGSPHGLIPPGGGLVAASASQGGQFCTLYGPPGRPGGGAGWGMAKIAENRQNF